MNIHSCDHQHPKSESMAQIIKEELFFHLPYAVFAVAFSLIILSLFDFLSVGKTVKDLFIVRWRMFHNLHFMHIAFACIGALTSFFRHSKSLWQGMLVGIISPSVFCILSDIIFPWLGARFLGVNMPLHICFINELDNILPFLIIGFVTGLVLYKQNSYKKNHKHLESQVDDFSLWSHSVHIFISSLASSFYFVANGFYDWADSIGAVFVVLIIAVLIPCTLSDVVVPAYFARFGNKKIVR